ncbi:hypothetical protein [Methylobacterium radiodurans]|nr:hypothetical protein [Methylobacterium radiodurans]
MMHWRRGAALAAAAILAGAWSAEAAAGCMRRVYNRSAYLLVASRDGGPPVTILPGRSVPLRLERPGTLSVAAYCDGAGPGAGPLAQASFSYTAVQDRCFIDFGDRLFVPQLGRGFTGRQGTAPFTVNNPEQGDVILGPFASEACPVLRRGG